MRLDTFLFQRKAILRSVEGLDEASLHAIVPYRRNNILWNLGHLLTVHQNLTYGLSGLPLNVPAHFVEMFTKGSDPSKWAAMEHAVPSGDELRERLWETAERFVADVRQGRFVAFTPYRTSTGLSIEDFEAAVLFDHFHEGTHFGVILSIRKELEAAS